MYIEVFKPPHKLVKYHATEICTWDIQTIPEHKDYPLTQSEPVTEICTQDIQNIPEHKDHIYK